MILSFKQEQEISLSRSLLYGAIEKFILKSRRSFRKFLKYGRDFGAVNGRCKAIKMIELQEFEEKNSEELLDLNLGRSWS